MAATAIARSPRCCAQAGWLVNDKRVERIWRREGLKVPARQPKRGRLWLTDGSCIRLRPEHRNHVWSYDFVEDRTHDGRKYRMLNIIDEFTHECLAIRVDRKLKADRRHRRAVGPVHPARRARAHPVRQRPGVRRQGGAGVDRRGRREDRLHRAGQPLGERLHRELQRPACATNCSTARSSTRSRRPDRHRKLAAPLQHDRPHASLGYRPPAPEVFVPAFAAWPAAQPRPAPPATLS